MIMSADKAKKTTRASVAGRTTTAPPVEVVGGVCQISVEMEASRPAPKNDPNGYTEFYAGVKISRSEDVVMQVNICTVASVIEGEEFARQAEFIISPGCIPVLAQVFAAAARKLEAHGFCSAEWP